MNFNRKTKAFLSLLLALVLLLSTVSIGILSTSKSHTAISTTTQAAIQKKAANMISNFPIERKSAAQATISAAAQTSR